MKDPHGAHCADVIEWEAIVSVCPQEAAELLTVLNGVNVYEMATALATEEPEWWTEEMPAERRDAIRSAWTQLQAAFEKKTKVRGSCLRLRCGHPGRGSRDTPMQALEETLTGYLPDVVLRRLARDPSLPTAPVLERFPAAVLFADISGFTRLTEHFARQGPCGAEQVSAHLNAYFEQLIDSIAGHGGDVVKFAGDALVCRQSSIDG